MGKDISYRFCTRSVSQGGRPARSFFGGIVFELKLRTAAMVKTPKPPPILALILAVITSQLSTGIVYGWPALLPILEQEGVYTNLCNGVGDKQLL